MFDLLVSLRPEFSESDTLLWVACFVCASIPMTGFLRKSNSTTTCFMQNTLFEPERNEIIFSACVALLSHIRTGMEKGIRRSGPDIFSEEILPLESTKTKRYRKATRDPDVEVLYSFITKIVDRVDLEETCIIMCLAFVERIMVFKQFDLLPTNWRRIVLTAFVIAAKTFYDEVVWNADFRSSFPNYDLSNLHKMELCMLEMLDYNVVVRQGLYAKYYFELRSISEEQNYGNLKKKHEVHQEGWEKGRRRTTATAGSLLMSDVNLPTYVDMRVSPDITSNRRGSTPNVDSEPMQ